jgi:hypothetical protein
MRIGEENIALTGKFAVQQARISIEQPASESIPTIPGLRRVNFPNQVAEDTGETTTSMPWQRPIELDVQVTAPRRIMVFGRGLDTEWGANLRVTGPVSDPSIAGTATLVRGDLDLAGRRFAFDTGTITLNGPIRLARIDIAADRSTADITASVRMLAAPFRVGAFLTMLAVRCGGDGRDLAHLRGNHGAHEHGAGGTTNEQSHGDHADQDGKFGLRGGSGVRCRSRFVGHGSIRAKVESSRP